METLITLKQIINTNQAVLAICTNDVISTYDERGIKPLYNIVDSIKDSICADKVVGRAAALLFCYAKVKFVFCKTLSQNARQVFEAQNVAYEYEKLVPFIENRDKTGMCPMEKLTLDIDSPLDAYLAIKKVLG